jgi:transcriptional regulator with XRE-family HTH domain
MREGRGWSQAELGRRVGLGQSRIAAIEATGQRAKSRSATVNIDQAVTFAQILSVPVEILLFEHLPSDAAVSTQQLVKILARAEGVQQSIEYLREDWAGLVSTIQGFADSP